MRPALASALGLRTAHYADRADGSAQVDWLEILSENCMVPGGKPLHCDKNPSHYPMAKDGVSLSFGSVAGPDLTWPATAQGADPARRATVGL